MNNEERVASVRIPSLFVLLIRGFCTNRSQLSEVSLFAVRIGQTMHFLCMFWVNTTPKNDSCKSLIIQNARFDSNNNDLGAMEPCIFYEAAFYRLAYGQENNTMNQIILGIPGHWQNRSEIL